MVKSMLAAASCFVLAGCGARIVALDIADSWFECERRRDCTILEDPRCTRIPINRRYADSFAAWVRRNRPEQVANTPCVWNELSYRPVCDSGRCSSSLLRSSASTKAVIGRAMASQESEMRCEQVSGILGDGEPSALSAAQRLAVNAHLARCVDCAGAWRAQQSLVRQRVPATPSRLFDTIARIGSNGP